MGEILRKSILGFYFFNLENFFDNELCGEGF